MARQVVMALFTTWLDIISSELFLLHGAVYEGLHRLGYDSVKPEQFDAVESLHAERRRHFHERHYRLWKLLCTSYCRSAQNLYTWVQVSICGSDQSDQLAEMN